MNNEWKEACYAIPSKRLCSYVETMKLFFDFILNGFLSYTFQKYLHFSWLVKRQLESDEAM